jgi:ferredoxin-like protein FixX
MITDTLLPVVKSKIFMNFINDYINNSQLPFDTLDRIKSENPHVYDHMNNVTQQYEKHKKLALICGANIYSLLEQTGEIPFIEEETLELFTAEISTPDYSSKLLKELESENKMILTLITIFDYESSPQEPMRCMGFNLYGLLKTQAKKNLFAKFETKETDQKSELENKIIN